MIFYDMQAMRGWYGLMLAKISLEVRLFAGAVSKPRTNFSGFICPRQYRAFFLNVEFHFKKIF
jgi:hypothetical protein